MRTTVDHIIQTVYQELSSQRVEKFRMADLIMKSKVSKNTIYYYFDDLEDVYKESFERLILQKITHEATTFDEMVLNLVTFIANHKIFCLNFYELTSATKNRGRYFEQILNEHLPKYNIKNVSTNLHLAAGIANILRRWFEDNLKTDLAVIIKEVRQYNYALEKAWI